MPDALQRFRRLTGRSRKQAAHAFRPRVPPREIALVGLLLVNVLWLVYALGGVRLWGELGGLALAVATLLLLPRWGKGELEGAGSPVWRLLRLPLFWCGFGLYAWFVIQSWNLAWEWTTAPDGRPKLLSLEPRVAWLPAGLLTPLDENNALRSMTYYAIPWLACSAAWAGLTTRRATRWLLHGLALLGVGFAVLALGQYFTRAERILGIFPTIPAKAGTPIPFWGTLINENHAAFFLILATGLCLGQFLSGWHRDLRQFRTGGGAWLLYLGCAIVTTFATLMAQARGAIAAIILFWLLFLAICSVFFIRRFGARGFALPGVILALFVVMGIKFVINPDIFERQRQEWIKTFSLVENPEAEARYFMGRISWDMIADKPWLGHGAGSFRYTHLPYLQRYPEFRTQNPRWLPNPITGKRERRVQTLWFQDAHVDLLQYVVEWGIVGCLFPLAGAAWLLYRGLRARHGWDSGGLTIVVAVLVVLLGGLVEFHLRIPLVLLYGCLSLTLAVKSADLEAQA